MNNKKYYQGGTYEGERALFMAHDAFLENVVFQNGESPLKESRNLEIIRCTFRWKYPVWYAQNVVMRNSLLEETARSGIWYTNDITLENCLIKYS